jgi:hypothetical protein
MGVQVKNKPVEQAQAELARQLAPRTGMSGTRDGDQDYEVTTAELDRLTNEMQVGHDRPTSK